MNITYRQFNTLLYTLVEQIKQSGRVFKRVVGIENGGLNISKPLAMFLELPHTSIKISRYEGKVKREKPIVEGKAIESGCLIVDDLIDDGGTIKLFDYYFGCAGNAVAVLFWNKNSPIKPDFYAAEKPDEWVKFPWEK